MTMTVTEAVHLGEEDIPWVDTGTGVELKLVQADIEAGLWIIRNRFTLRDIPADFNESLQRFVKVPSIAFHFLYLKSTS